LRAQKGIYGAMDEDFAAVHLHVSVFRK
jgi:hypothetical protein